MRLSAHCHALAGFAYVPPWSVNAGVVWGQEQTLIIDTGPTAQAAATILGYAQVVRPGNRILAINTELHLDHVAGNHLLRQHGVPVYGHVSIARSEADLADDVSDYAASVTDPQRRDEGALPFLHTHIANPDHKIDGDMVVELGGIQAHVLLAPGHTTANLMVWIASEGVAYVGDTVVSGYRPNVTGDRLAWLTALDRLKALDPQIVVPGHGETLRSREAIAAEIRRMRACLAQTE
jgi:cyclase